MPSVSASEARAHLPRLLHRVEQGESITITRRGVPIATLNPVSDERRRAFAAVDALRRFPRIKLEGVTIRELIDDGRRFV